MRHRVGRRKLQRTSATVPPCSATWRRRSSSMSRSPPPSPRRRSFAPMSRNWSRSPRGRPFEPPPGACRLLDDAQLVKCSTYGRALRGSRRRLFPHRQAGIRWRRGASIIEFVDRDVSAKGQDLGPVMTDRGRNGRLIAIIAIKFRPRASSRAFFVPAAGRTIFMIVSKRHRSSSETMHPNAPIRGLSTEHFEFRT